MPVSKKASARVVVRQGVDLNKIVSDGWMNELQVPCGNKGRLIAKQVLDGHGEALIPFADLVMAMDSRSGVLAFLDRFEVLETNSKEPILLTLLRERLRPRK